MVDTMAKWLTSHERSLLDSLYNLNHESIKNTVLDEYMKKIRQKRVKISSKKRYELYESGDLIQLWFQTPPCRFSEIGKCTMCNYWNGQKIPNIVQSMLKEISLPDSCQTLLINTCGSCLDSYEVSDDDLLLLLDWLEKCKAKKIIFETHWTTLSLKKLDIIRRHIPNKSIMYEIGLESTNKDTLYYILNKPSSLIDIQTIIKKIHQHNAKCIINILFGIPFLTPKEQIMDTVSSIQFLLKQNVDYIVVFPINLKPQTLFMELYKKNHYSPVPIKIIAEIFLKYFPSKLDRINIAWFGDRSEEGLIQPKMCNICASKTILLFKNYNS